MQATLAGAAIRSSANHARRARSGWSRRRPWARSAAAESSGRAVARIEPLAPAVRSCTARPVLPFVDDSVFRVGCSSLVRSSGGTIPHRFGPPLVPKAQSLGEVSRRRIKRKSGREDRAGRAGRSILHRRCARDIQQVVNPRETCVTCRSHRPLPLGRLAVSRSRMTWSAGAASENRREPADSWPS